MFKVRRYTLAIPALLIADLISDSIDMPWWAYLVLILGYCFRYETVEY